MQIIFYKNQKNAGANVLSAFAASLIFSLIFCLFFGSACFSSSNPTKATDNYSIENNEYIDGQTESLIYDTGVVVGDELDINGQSVFVKGNIYFKAANGETLHINVGQNTPGTSVTIQPFANKIVKFGTTLTTEEAPTELSPGHTNDMIDTTKNYAHLCFCPDSGGTIEVNLFKDLYLTGSNYSQDGATSITGFAENESPLTISTDDLVTDLTLSFTGDGQTIFKFADGKALIMESMKWDSQSNTHTFDNLREGINAGVRVLVAMDQNKDSVVTKGRNKVIFQRIDYNGGNQNSVVRIGRNSFLTYCSRNIDGLDTTAESYAAIAFDVSNTGEGRFELQITGSETAGTYVDGSIQICGSFLGHINDSDPQNPEPMAALNYDNPFDFSGIDPASVHKSFGKTTSTGVDFSQPAGSVAYLRVIDNLAYKSDPDYQAALNPNSGEPGVKSGGIHTRRGLLIVNNNYSIPPFASNTYSDAGWFYSNGPSYVNNIGSNKILPYRPGFILGVNGHIEVNHNTFMEYEALSLNIEIEPARNGFLELDSKLTSAGITDPGVVLKKHNPSAFIVDGLETILRFENPTTHSLYDPAVELIHFRAHTSENVVRHAEITLRGNASFTCRAPLLSEQGIYNGYRVPVPNKVDSSGNIISYGETPGEGIHVMDIEGLFSIRSINDSALADPAGLGWHGHVGNGYWKSGVFRLGSIYRTFDDREAKSHLTLTPEYLTRPLLLDTAYSRYDKPTILTNASFDFIDLNFHNEDITRDVIADPLQADPIFVGGEKATFSADVDLNRNPDISFWRIYNTNIHCHESMCISGIRLLVRELPAFQTGTSDEGSNTSNIIFYNHGNALDTSKKGYGRLFMFGTNNNEVASGGTSVYMSNAFANIFRHTGKAVSSNANGGFKNKDAVLKLQTKPEVPSGTNQDERAMHMLILGNSSYIDVGWTSTVGLTKSSAPANVTIYPFDHTNPSTVTQANQFILRTTTTADGEGEKPAELNIDGDYIFFGARDANGNGSPRTVDDYNLGRVLYVGHGGKLSIGSDTSVTPHRPYIGFTDATIAMKVWKEKAGEHGLSAILDLPADQMKHSNPIHPYGLDLNVLTDSDNKHLSLSSLIGQSLGSEICISWDKVSNVPSTPTSALPLETILGSFFDQTRAILTSNVPVTMPDRGLLYMTSGDLIDQLTISGATPANPFKFYMTGDDKGISQIREVASVKSDTLVPGEGAYAKFYLDGGAELGLGTRHWNNESLGAWNKIGLSQVLLHPNGDCSINVNSDLVVFDQQPIIPTDKFGSQYKGKKLVNNALVDAVISPSHRITFISQNSNEIRIPAGKELDLSAFGKAKEMTAGEAGTGTLLEALPAFTQSIAIGGKLRIIFEPGSTLRFPDLGDFQVTADKDNVEKMPVLYMNEESELVFEALQDLDNKADWTSISDLDRAKVKIVGCGQIWLNKHAKMTINDNAIVSVEADSQTKNTNMTISIQREGSMVIGDMNNAGGSFQVGNPTNVSDAKIDFTLRFAGEASELMVGRNGFLGFGAGTVNRTSTSINKWTLAPLYNVRNINIRNISGIISHNRIFDGSDRESSLLAIGPAVKYTLEQSERNAIIRGGGNIVYVHSTPATNPFAISILSSAISLVGDATDNGKYTILNTSESMKQILSPPAGFTDTLIETITEANSTALSASILTSNDVSGLVNGLRIKAGQAEFYKLLSAGGINDIKSQNPKRFVALGPSTTDERIGYVNGETIVRTPGFSMQNETRVADGLNSGALKVATKDNNENPTSFTPPGR